MKRALVVIAALLAGCTPQPPERTADAIQLEAYGTVAAVQEITLKDGTRCAVIFGVNKAGIDCEWRTH